MNYFLLKDVAEKGWTKGQVVNLDATESAEWLANGTLVVGSTAPVIARNEATARYKATRAVPEKGWKAGQTDINLSEAEAKDLLASGAIVADPLPDPEKHAPDPERGKATSKATHRDY